MKRILVLYRELAGYFLACLDELCDHHNVHADVIAYPVHKDAPFRFRHSNKISISFRAEYNRQTLRDTVSKGDYNIIFVSGWFDKDYLHAIGARKCPALIGFDNPWQGSPKHYLASLYGRLFIKPKFDYAFVPGGKQKQFAKHLGFSNTTILTGLYSCDVPQFRAIQHRGSHPKRLVYVGRYAPEKFIPQLFEAFLEINNTLKNHWELHCVGVGPLFDQRIEHPHIYHHGFMQPEELTRFMAVGDAFVLPSLYEPWGLVVHEFAAAGYPMILSDAVCAGEAFLKPGLNGYRFEAGQPDSLKHALNQLMNLTGDELDQMGEHSRALAQSISPELWAKSIYALMT